MIKLTSAMLPVTTVLTICSATAPAATDTVAISAQVQLEPDVGTQRLRTGRAGSCPPDEIALIVHPLMLFAEAMDESQGASQAGEQRTGDETDTGSGFAPIAAQLSASCNAAAGNPGFR